MVKKESRIMLDESMKWNTVSKAHDVCRRLSEGGFNVLVANVWHGGGVTWPTALNIPFYNHPNATGMEGRDPIADLLEIAPLYNIEVHAWITVALRQRDFFNEFWTANTPDGMFDMHLPEFHDFMQDVVDELMERYEFPGLFLDYARVGTHSWNNTDWQALYATETGRDLLQDWAVRNSNPEAKESVFSWNIEAVTKCVYKLSSIAKTHNRDVVVSTYGIPNHFDTLAQGNDPNRWLNEGHTSVCFTSNYKWARSLDDLRAERDTLDKPHAMVPIVGNYINTDPVWIADKLMQCGDFASPNGRALYIYNRYDDAEKEEIRNTVFPTNTAPRWTGL